MGQRPCSAWATCCYGQRHRFANPHGAFVSDDEVHRVVSYLKSQGEPNYIEGVLEGGTVEVRTVRDVLMEGR